MTYEMGQRILRFLSLLILVMIGCLVQIEVAPHLWDRPDYVAAAEAPTVIVVEQAAPATYHGCIRSMHMDAASMPRLFTRFMGFQLEPMIQAQEIDSKLATDLPFLARMQLTLVEERLREEFFHTKNLPPMTEEDWRVYRDHVEGHGCDLMLTDWLHIQEGVGGYAPGDNLLGLPENDCSLNGMPPIAMAIHEYTHLIQFVAHAQSHREFAVALSTFGTDSVELAAMVAETAQMICNGLTREEAIAADLQRDSIRGLTPCQPRLAGGLVWDYVVRYGPHLTGNFAHDLDEIDRWLPTFEIGGRLPHGAHWMDTVRADIAAGETTDLAMAYETFLLINGEATIFPADSPDTADGPAPSPVNLAPALASLPQDRAAAVKAFLTRCGIR